MSSHFIPVADVRCSLFDSDGVKTQVYLKDPLHASVHCIEFSKCNAKLPARALKLRLALKMGIASNKLSLYVGDHTFESNKVSDENQTVVQLCEIVPQESESLLFLPIMVVVQNK
jgi:hypothetical protein